MESTYAQSVAAEVRGEMGRQRMTGTALATRMRVSQAVISRRLTGEVPFDIAELHEIAQILEVPITHLMPEAVDARAPMRKAG